MPDTGGHQLMDHINQKAPDIDVIIIIGNASLEFARFLYPLNSPRRGRSPVFHPHPAVYTGICIHRIFLQSPDNDPGPVR